MIVIYADIETTGLSPNRGTEITEIGLIKADGYRIFDIFHTFINIKGNIPFDISVETGITKEMLSGFPTIENLQGIIADFIHKAPILAYNAPFEKVFLDYYKITQNNHRYLDLYPWIREMRLPTINNKLQTIIKYYNIESAMKHRAVADALSLYNVVYRLAWVDRIHKALKV